VLYAEAVSLLEKNNLVVCEIKRDRRDEETTFIANNITPLEDEIYE
jgi:hypothetical protein